MSRVAELGNFATCCNRGKLPVSNAAFARCKGNTWRQCGSMVAINKRKASWNSEMVEDFPVHNISAVFARKTWILSSPASQQLLTTTPSWRRFLELLESSDSIGFGLSDRHDRWCWTMDWDNRRGRVILASQLAWLKVEQLEATSQIHCQEAGILAAAPGSQQIQALDLLIAIPLRRLGRYRFFLEHLTWFLACFHCRNVTVFFFSVCVCCTGNHSRWAWAYCTWCRLQIGLPTCANTTRGVPRPFGRMWDWKELTW